MVMSDGAMDILVEEVMTKSPRTGSPEMTVKEAAVLMRDENVGSLIIVEDELPIGIVTERDFLNKIVSENKVPSKILVKEIMTSPLITATAKEPLSEAAKRMSAMHVRRLPVVKGDMLVGVLTENDVLRISPSLIELTREWSLLNRGGIGREKEPQVFTGYCENCGQFSIDLRLNSGELRCPECRDLGP
jgi:CBS domain-containing protein